MQINTCLITVVAFFSMLGFALWAATGNPLARIGNFVKSQWLPV